MIDLARIRRHPTRGGIALEVLRNLIPVLLMLYGLVCAVTQDAYIITTYRAPWRLRTIHFQLLPVTGAVAFDIGSLLFFVGLFIYFSDGSPPPENRPLTWRIGRALARWGALFIALAFFVDAERKIHFGNSISQGLAQVMFLEIFAVVAGITVVASFLRAMYLRQQVKRYLADNNCQALHVLWVPAAYWLPWSAFHSAGFRVIYADSSGLVHRGYCYAFRIYVRESSLTGMYNRYAAYDVKWLTNAVV